MAKMNQTEIDSFLYALCHAIVDTIDRHSSGRSGTISEIGVSTLALPATRQNIATCAATRASASVLMVGAKTCAPLRSMAWPSCLARKLPCKQRCIGSCLSTTSPTRTRRGAILNPEGLGCGADRSKAEQSACAKFQRSLTNAPLPTSFSLLRDPVG